MDKPAIEFVEELYSKEEIEKMVTQFQEKGYVILPDVFKRETVDPFVKQLEEIMIFDGLKNTIPHNSPHYIHCAYTPRARQVLPYTLSHLNSKPYPCLNTTIIIIQKDGDTSYIPEWHKDHSPEGMPGKEYYYPSTVFLAFYFEDMTDEHGPTLTIPGTHRDLSIYPVDKNSYADVAVIPDNDDKKLPVEAIHCRKQDAVLLDQRIWHRGTARKAPGTRYIFVYGAYPIAHFYGTVTHMPESQLHAWIHAKNMKDRVFFGGYFAPPDREALKAMEKELDELEKAGGPVREFLRAAY
ncbi:phytanoyl-CoA dioxygenase family protein [Desulfobacter sp.]|uniref:phytanoyl-CoA dioxygenase family protein n=1 Tax=Desulfobacter sp. TaxID=2294 RepID=UPI003D119791